MRYLSIFTLLAASASLASASIITMGCSQVVNTGQTVSPGGNMVCGGFTVPGGSTLFSIVYNYAIDFSFNPLTAPGGTASVNATINAPGAYDVAVNFNNTARPNVGSVTVNVADWAAFLAGATLGTAHVGTVGVTSSTFDALVTFTYEVNPPQGGVPEPSTLALVGGVLVLAGIRKFRS